MSEDRNMLRVAAIQMCSTGNRDANLVRANSLMEEAVENGAKLLSLPENFAFIGREGDQVQVAEDLEDGPSVQFLRDFAGKHRVAIVGGSIALKTSDASRVSNTCLVFDPAGELVARYDKMHLFDVSVDEEHSFQESRYVEAGKNVVTASLFGHPAGLSICYDLRFPELYRALALAGAEMLFVPSAFTVPTGKVHWEALLRARAIENQCYVIAPAQFGRHNARRTSFGQTMVVDPWGEVLGRCEDKDTALVCDLDFTHLEDVRNRLPSLEHARKGRVERAVVGSGLRRRGD
jgi:nitrilase